MSIHNVIPIPRLILRKCGTCGKQFLTTSSSERVRKIARDGKKNATTYYCSDPCFGESYLTAKTADRREYYKAYYQANREKKLRYYAENKDAINAYMRKARAAG